VAPPGGKPVSGSWDRAFFRHEAPDRFPLVHGPTMRFNSGWDLAYAAQRPNVIAGIAYDHRQCCSKWIGSDNQSGLSADGGKSWTVFPAIADGSLPADLKFGNIAIAARDTGNLVWLPTDDKPPYVTFDGGKTWDRITLRTPGGQPVSPAGSYRAPYLSRQAVVADPVTDRTFYLFHSQSNHLFRSGDGGRTWQAAPGPQIKAANISEVYAFSAKLKVVPGRARHLCLSDGGAQPLRCTRDAGVQWQEIPGASRVTNFAFGKAARGSKVPTLFIQGFVRDTPGIWCSVDMGRSWGLLGQYPLGMPAQARAMDADKDLFGTVYLGTTGNGFIIGTAPLEKNPKQLCGGVKI
jgi:photosystem II stability/assembly factor-like uncharacterized protein